MSLNDRQIRNAKPSAKPYKLADGGGLYLQITPAGGKLWRLKYRIDGREKLLSIGKYPALSLVEARQAADTARAMLAQGQDPAAAKQEAKRERQAALLNTFSHLAGQWHKANLHRWKPNHAVRVMRYLENDVFPHIGSRPIAEIGVRDIQSVTDRIIERGAIETADKVRQWIGAVFDYAALLDLVSGNPASPLRKIMPKRETRHMPALPKDEITEFYRRLLLADAEHQNRIAILLLMLLFLRNKELRGGEWKEIDLKAGLWTVPAERMKRPRLHIVPLSDWALELLTELHGMTGQGRFLFPSRTAADGYISENTLGNIMHGMGYKGIATPHGFRSLASSAMNEHGFNPDAIERQLSHAPKDKVRAAYNHADYQEERQQLMQWWSDFLRRRYDAAASIVAAER